jgi:predicted transcriptional regulator
MQEFQYTETFVQILRKINTGDGMYFSNYQAGRTPNMDMYLGLLEKNSLIKHEGNKVGYTITIKGIEYLNAHDKFIQLLIKK